jgi:hypothetical protein
VRQDKNQKLILLGILTLVVLSYPLITIANKAALVWGFPALYLFIFIAWIIIIFIVFGISTGKYKEPDE